MRLNVAGRVLAAYAAPLLLLFIYPGEGSWLAMLLVAASWPLLLLALAISFAFAPSVASRPLAWSSAAVLVSLAAGFVLAGMLGLTLGAILALMAALTFIISTKKWPFQTSPLG
jgi:hypothetical protein